MNDALPRRLAVLTGLALAAAMALWWLGSSRLALNNGADASRSAADTLHALWLVRGMALATMGPRVAALRGWRSGAAATLGLIAPSWPLVVLAWSASAAPPIAVALAECLLLAASVVLPLVGQGLRRVLRRPELAEAMATLVGLTLAASWWLSRSLWSPAMA